MKSPRHLLKCWPETLKKLRAAKSVFLFLDFDGTLVRLRRRPKDVRLPASRRRLLQRLARRERVSLYFISGRSLAELHSLIRVPGAQYLGLHGWEQDAGTAPHLPHKGREGGSKSQRAKVRTQTRLDMAKKTIQASIQKLPGMWLQDKRVCFAVHYRAANAEDTEKARALVMRTLERLGPEFRMLAGKKIWEILPRGIGTKGDAARQILARRGGRPAVFYFGDDTTDETAFTALRTAFTVRVGKFHKTSAHYYLNGPGEVSQFLSKLDHFLEYKLATENPKSKP